MSFGNVEGQKKAHCKYSHTQVYKLASYLHSHCVKHINPSVWAHLKVLNVPFDSSQLYIQNQNNEGVLGSIF